MSTFGRLRHRGTRWRSRLLHVSPPSTCTPEPSLDNVHPRRLRRRHLLLRHAIEHAVVESPSPSTYSLAVSANVVPAAQQSATLVVKIAVPGVETVQHNSPSFWDALKLRSWVQANRIASQLWIHSVLLLLLAGRSHSPSTAPLSLPLLIQRFVEPSGRRQDGAQPTLGASTGVSLPSIRLRAPITRLARAVTFASAMTTSVLRSTSKAHSHICVICLACFSSMMTKSSGS